MKKKLSVDNIAMWFYCFSAGSETTCQLLKNSDKKRLRMDFWYYHMTPYGVSNGQVISLREVIIYCIPTSLTSQINLN